MTVVAKYPHFGEISSSPEHTTWILEDRPCPFIRKSKLHEDCKCCSCGREVSQPCKYRANDSSALREKGFSAADEKKIIALKDFIVKQAHASKA
jgi:hypothetical protein